MTSRRQQPEPMLWRDDVYRLALRLAYAWGYTDADNGQDSALADDDSAWQMVEAEDEAAEGVRHMLQGGPA